MAKIKANKKTPLQNEKTPPQIVSYALLSYGANIAELSPTTMEVSSYNEYRRMRKDPTIALARSVAISAILSGQWTVQCADDVDNAIVKAVQDNFVRHRQKIIESAMAGCIDFGWQPFEVVWRAVDGRIEIDKFKPLLQDFTIVLIDLQTGAFAGYKQQTALNAAPIILPKENCLHIALGVEGTQWYGSPLLENAREIQNKWIAADYTASVYDKKIAGSHFIIHYPPGTSKVNDKDVDNGVIAAELLKALEGSGSASVPRMVAPWMGELGADETGWKIEILEDSGGRQPQFVDREKYLDTLKVRALLTPERAILEGEFGTKAEASVHGDIAIMITQIRDRQIVQSLNEVVDRFLVLNYGEQMRGKVWLESAPLVNEKLQMLKTVYASILTNPQGFAEEFDKIDTDSLKDLIGIPKSKEVAAALDKDDTSKVSVPGMQNDKLQLLKDVPNPAQPESKEE